MDKNQTIGLVLISAIILSYIVFFAPSNEEVRDIKPVTSQDSTQSIEVAESNEATVTESSNELEENPDVQESVEASGKKYIVENQDLIITFNNKGGLIESVELKNYKTHEQEPLILFDEQTNKLNLKLDKLALDQVLFETQLQDKQTVAEGDSLIINFESNGIQQTYIVKDKGYVINYQINGKDANKLFIDWETYLKQLEDDSQFSLTHSGLYYYTADEDFENFGDGSGQDEEKPESSLAWVSSKQRFFNYAFIGQSANFENAKLNSSTDGLLPQTFKKLHGSFELPLKDNKGSYNFYVGPNDYDVLKKVTDGFENNVYLGWPVIDWLNKFLVLPLFRLLEMVVSNYGVIILLLVFIIKALLFPIAYKSYLSMATMKELKPEIDEIKERVGKDNMQAIQQESMKLYQQVGVNPLSGCIPMLLQMPVLLALFNFFPNSIELRQESFLWATDLSTYDALVSWDANIPVINMILGNHISIFTLLMTLSTLAYTYYNNQINPGAQGPMKMVGYLMPVVFFFVLNSYSSGLTFYYFVSNVITIGQQLIATRFIDKDKIRRKLEDNKKNISTGKKKQSKFQQRLQDAMKAQQEARKK